MPRCLLVNDDGPPSSHSPHILGFHDALVEAGWDVRVVIPSSQKSWGGMAATLAPVALCYYPLQGNYSGKNADTANCWSPVRRPRRQGETAEWVLCDGSPTSCTNIGLFNSRALFPDDPPVPDGKPAFDLVISGPNFGRNTGTAFALASGTVGAALAGALAGVRSISLSYGHFTNLPPALEKARQSNVGGLDAKEESRSVSKLAHHAACRIVERLSSTWEPNVGVYAVNLPLGWTLREPTAVYTTMWDSIYGQLYQPFKAQPTAQSDLPSTSSSAHTPSHAPAPASKVHFSPVMTSLLNPPLEALPEGTDIWALMNGLISVTRLSPRFMEPTLVAEAASNSSTLEPADESLRIGARWRL
ncbi:sure-like protein [Ceraceosorus guamensis]|uniref:Sure-like protein n=1 Tax=Ceraceosorus guamensis TaxID=1522189 RepID=A0A316WEY8_9BASI|nr:sure-like protein [Ceraceosorus guamensis]PWN45885.1 sure-like protein [Ceraceosorus guamensis]